MNEDITTLELGLNSSYRYKVHPSVPLAILEYYYRKRPNRVVGTLLGLVHPDHVDITNCYAVKYEAIVSKTDSEDPKQTKEYALDKDYHKKMLELNQKIYPKELVIGFFVTQSHLDFDVAALNQYYSNTKESSFTNNGILQAPIILTINPEMENGSFDLKAFSSVSLPILKDSFAAFQELNLSLEYNEQDKNEMAPMINKQLQNSDDKNQLDIINLDNMEHLLNELVQNLKLVQKYVQDVRQKKVKEDPKMGKVIKKLLKLRPMLSKEEFNSLISKHMQDVLLAMFLHNFANTQALISEKLIKV